MRTLLGGSLALAASGCLSPATPDPAGTTTTSSSSSPATDPSPIPTFTPAAGARAAKIIFKKTFPAGSFDAPPVSGTPAVPGSGLAAQRVFNADGSLLAQGGSSAPSWPKWLSKFEIGVSGASNLSATSADCARFANSGESAATVCSFGNCGAEDGIFRISGYDCGSAAVGNGGPADGVYFRATFSRSAANLNPYENIMAVIEYAASGINAAPSDPTTCFTNGTFTPGNCADQLWQTFLKHDPYEVVQPFLMLVPPTISVAAATTSGTMVSTKQIFIPLAGDPGLTVFQISRISGLPTSDANFTATCTAGGAGGTPANSALCVGMVIYSITFFRI